MTDQIQTRAAVASSDSSVTCSISYLTLGLESSPPGAGMEEMGRMGGGTSTSTSSASSILSVGSLVLDLPEGGSFESSGSSGSERG